MYKHLIRFIRHHYETNEQIPLHSPLFLGHEKEYVNQAIDSTFVSSVGHFVDQFERDVEIYTGSPRAVATVNGTAAVHIALKLAGVVAGDLVLTQPLTFVATCNAIRYCDAEPIFIDVDRSNLSLSPVALLDWLEQNAQLDQEGLCRLKADGRIVRACMPMHTFGHPAKLDDLLEICNLWGLVLVEDAAESLGSFYKGFHTGTFGVVGALSFNGNKIITTGGGGMILTNEHLGIQAKHLTTTAKIPHPYEYSHDQIGYNYRLPNLNAALGVAQLQQLEVFISNKRELAMHYANLLKESNLQFVAEPQDCRSNYWLNAVLCEDLEHRDQLLKFTNDLGIMTRPIWDLMNSLPMFKNCRHGNLSNAQWLADRIVNLPSSVKMRMNN